MAQGGYLIVDDHGGKHLPTTTDGKPDHQLMGAAWAALHEGYRGNKYEGPHKAEAITKLAALYKREGMKTPGSETSRAALCSVIPPGEPPASILIIPAGQVDSRDSRAPWINDDPEAVIAASDALDMTAGLPIDYDHATDIAAPKGLPAPAAGWIKKLRVQDGAIWGDIEWTERGAKAVASGEWKYISPVFDYANKTRVITRVLRAALTNNPALFNTAIAAAEGQEACMDHDEFKKKMGALFGQPDDATHEDIHAAAKKHVEAAAKKGKKAKADAQDGDGDGDGNEDAATASRLIATGKVVSQENYASLLTEVNTLKSESARTHATAKVDEAQRARKLMPNSRDWAISYCMSDEKGFDEFISKQVPMDLDRQSVRGTPTAAKEGEPALSHAEREVVGFLTGITPAEMAAARGKRLNLTVKPQFGGEKVNLGK